MNRLVTTIITIATLCCLTGFRTPPGPDRYMELGDKAQTEGRTADALELYARGIELAPDNPDYYMTRAFLYMKVKRGDDALRDLGRYIELVPNSVQGYMSRGMLLDDLGRKQEAAADFLQACRLGERGGCSFAGEGK